MIGFFLQQQQHILSLYLCFKDVKEGGHACCKPQTTSSLIRVLASTSTWTSPTAVFLQESTKATKNRDVERRTGLMERDVEKSIQVSKVQCKPAPTKSPTNAFTNLHNLLILV